MTLDKLVLLIIDEAGGSLKGKTLLQKRGYFLSRLLGMDLGYRPHYYGPYSPELEDALNRAKALGFVEERTLAFGVGDDVGFEVRRYDFTLTDDGTEIVKFLREQNPAECDMIHQCLRRLAEAGDTGDYMLLSVAAKTHYILSERQAAMTASEIRSAAKELGWNIDLKSTEKAVSFLEALRRASGNVSVQATRH